MYTDLAFEYNSWQSLLWAPRRTREGWQLLKVLSIVMRSLDKEKIDEQALRIIRGMTSVSTASRQGIIAVYSRFLKCHWDGAFLISSSSKVFSQSRMCVLHREYVLMGKEDLLFRN